MTDWQVSARWDYPTSPPVMTANAAMVRRQPGAADRIIAEVAREWGMTPKYLVSQCRRRRVAWARFEAAYRIRMECPWFSLPMIGRRLGGRDHTSVLNALRRYQALMASGEILTEKGGKAPRETRQEEEGTMSLNPGAAPNNEA